MTANCNPHEPRTEIAGRPRTAVHWLGVRHNQARGHPITQPGATSSSPNNAPLTEAEDRQWASLAHLLGILGFLPSLIIWLIFRERGAFTKAEGKEALNFQITMLIIEIVGYLTSIAFIGFLILPAVYVVRIVFSILAYNQSKDGASYRYPLTLRLIT